MVFSKTLAHERDPEILVRSAQSSRNDGYLSGVADQFGGFIDQRVADIFRRSLVDEVVSRIGLRVRVPGHYLNAAGARLPQDGRYAWCVLDAHGDSVHASCNPALDYFVLFGRVQACGTVPDDIEVQLLRRFFRSDTATDEIGISLGLRHYADQHAPGARSMVARM